MNNAVSLSVANQRPGMSVIGLKAAVKTDSGVVTQELIDVLKQGGNAAEVA